MTPVRPFFLSFSATVYPSRMRPWFSCANNWRSCLRSARWNRPWEWPWPWRRPERKPVPTRKLHYHWLMRTQSERKQTVWSAGKRDCCWFWIWLVERIARVFLTNQKAKLRPKQSQITLDTHFSALCTFFPLRNNWHSKIFCFHGALEAKDKYSTIHLAMAFNSQFNGYLDLDRDSDRERERVQDLAGDLE